MTDLIDELEHAIRTHCTEAMRGASKTGVGSLDTRSLVARYAAWKARFPTVQPRTIYESDAVIASPHRATYSDGIAVIRRDIAAGAELGRYLSSRVSNAEGRDLLLANASIHHLHLSDVNEDWGGVKRTKHVLFVAFRPGAAYFIDIYPHESDGANWAEKRILETVVRNWPDAGILHASRFAVGVTRDHEDATRAELRRTGVNLAVEIDGRVWSPLGATVTGAPLIASRIGMEVAAELHSLRAAGVPDLEANLAESVPEHQVSLEDWVPIVDDEHYGFYAERIQVFVRYGRLIEA